MNCGDKRICGWAESVECYYLSIYQDKSPQPPSFLTVNLILFLQPVSSQAENYSSRSFKVSTMVSTGQVSNIHRGPRPLSSISTTFTISMTTTYHDDPLLTRDLCHPAILRRPVMELIWLLRRSTPSPPPSFILHRQFRGSIWGSASHSGDKTPLYPHESSMQGDPSPPGGGINWIYSFAKQGLNNSQEV